MNLINKSKKAVALLLVIAMSVMVMPVQAATIMDGDLVKAADSSATYLISGATKRVFPHANVYASWGYPSNFSTVKTISAADLASYADGEPVPFRDGSLFRGTAASLHGKDATAVFLVSEGKLRPVLSAEIYQALYADADWARVTWVPDDLLSKFNYALGETVTSSAAHPNGALVKYTGTDSVFLVENGQKRAISSAAMTANRYLASSVVTIAATEAYADGVAITGAETALLTPAIATTTPVVAGTLAVALASDSPASATIISDTTNTNAQALVPFVKVNFTASATGAVKVTTLKFTRGGISSDTDLSAASLWDGDTKLADYNSFITKVVTFTKAGGLFTVPAGTTKAITFKGDLTDGTGSGKTISFSLAAASDVTTDGATVTGTAAGKTMSTAGITDLATMTITSSTQPAALDPGTTNQEVWAFTVDPNLQDVKIEKVKLTMVGTASATDLANFKLYESATLLGSVAAMDSDKTITFNNLNYSMTKSATTKTFSLKADIVSGTSRSFYFSIENMEDFRVKDVNYDVYIKPNSADTWTIIKAAAATDINYGTLTITKSTNSPTGNVADNGTDIELARFDFKASGEDVKVISLPIAIDLSTATTINNIKTLVDGSQVGITNASMNDNEAETFSFSNTFVVPAGTTKVLSIRGDIEGTSMGGAATIVAKVNQGSGNARGMSSSTSISTAAGSGNTLTVATGTLSAAKNIALAEGAENYPTGVAGTTNVRIASFVLTAGSAEGAKISQIVIRDADSTTFLGSKYQNLMLKHGTDQIGNTQGTLTAAATSYTFTPASTINLAASESYVLDVYADIKSGVDLTTATALAKLYTISYTTAVTAESSTWSDGIVGQTNYIATAGDLRVSKDNTSPGAKQLVMSTSDEILGIFKLQQYNGAEALNISKFIITDTLSNAAAAGEVNNIRIYDGSTLLGTVPTLSLASSVYTATFNLASNLVIPKAGVKLLTVKADITPYQGNLASGYTHTIKLNSAAAIVARGASSNTTVTMKDSSGGAFDAGDANVAAHYVYYTKPTFALNSASPSGKTVPSAAQTVLKFDVTANASNEVTLKSIKFQVTGTSAAVAVDKTYTLKDWNGASIGSVVTTTASSKYYVNLTSSDLTATVIPAGTTKTFTLEGDTSLSATDKSLQVVIEASADVVWNDGIADVTSTLNNAIPLYGGTVTY